MVKRQPIYLLSLIMGTLLLAASCGRDARKDYPRALADSIVLDAALPVASGGDAAACNVAIRFDYVAAIPGGAVPQEMNRVLLRELLGAGYGGKEVRQALDSFLVDYEARYRQEMAQLRAFSEEYAAPLPENIGYSIEIDNRLVYNDYGIATFRCLQREQAAGAEPETRVRLLNFDLLTGDLISLDGLFAEGYEEHVDALLLRSLLKINKVSGVKELEELGYFTSSSLYPSPDFCIEGRNLLFFYNPDDGIGPYDADGATVIPVELDDLSFIFSLDSPLHRLEK